MDHVTESLHILLAEKEVRIWFNIICLKIYQFERTTWWCLFVLEFVLKSILKSIMLKKYVKKHGLPKFGSDSPLGGRPNENSKKPWNLIHSLPCRLFIHEVFFGPLGLHLCVWIEIERTAPYWPMRALRLEWSWGFSLVCEVALNKTLLSS